MRLNCSAIAPLSMLVGTLWLTGCKTESTVGFILQPSDRATITVEGMNPSVGVQNNGPGEVMVLFTPDTGLPEGASRLIRGLNARTLSGGGQVQIANDSPERADVHVTIQHHTGVTLKQDSTPTPPPTPAEPEK